MSVTIYTLNRSHPSQFFYDRYTAALMSGGIIISPNTETVNNSLPTSVRLVKYFKLGDVNNDHCIQDLHDQVLF